MGESESNSEESIIRKVNSVESIIRKVNSEESIIRKVNSKVLIGVRMVDVKVHSVVDTASKARQNNTESLTSHGLC